jgi:hypothetical protein
MSSVTNNIFHALPIHIKTLSVLQTPARDHHESESQILFLKLNYLFKYHLLPYF